MSLLDKKVTELRALAKQHGVRGISKMKRPDLLAVLMRMEETGGSLALAAKTPEVASRLDLVQLRKLVKAERRNLMDKYAKLDKMDRDQLEALLTGVAAANVEEQKPLEELEPLEEPEPLDEPEPLEEPVEEPKPKAKAKAKPKAKTKPKSKRAIVDEVSV
jgi:outer membrane biosynthesis protein TonB